MDPGWIVCVEIDMCYDDGYFLLLLMFDFRLQL